MMQRYRALQRQGRWRKKRLGDSQGEKTGIAGERWSVEGGGDWSQLTDILCSPTSPLTSHIAY
jgi:hypothetical protein